MANQVLNSILHIEKTYGYNMTPSWVTILFGALKESNIEFNYQKSGKDDILIIKNPKTNRIKKLTLKQTDSYSVNGVFKKLNIGKDC